MHCFETFWDQKIKQEILTKFTKILNYIKSSCMMFCAKLFQYFQYILPRKKSAHFGLEVPKHYWSGGFETFWTHKIIQEKLKNVTKVLNYIKSSYCSKLFWYPQIISYQNVLIPPPPPPLPPGHILVTNTKKSFPNFISKKYLYYLST